MDYDLPPPPVTVQELRLNHPFFTATLHTNHALPPFLIPYIQHSLLPDVDTELYMLSVQTGIARLHSKRLSPAALSTAQTLARRADELNACAAGLRAMMAPARRVPREIWVGVFKWVCAGRSGARGMPRVRWGSSAEEELEPMILCMSVCRAWREMIVGTPWLWSRFCVQVGYGKEGQIREGKALIRAVRMWLERSGQCPLDVSVTWSWNGEEGSKAGLRGIEDRGATKGEPEGVGEELVSMLIGQSRRWRKMHISLPMKHLLPLVWGAGSKEPEFLLLEALDISYEAVHGHGEPLDTALSFRNAPNLRSFRWSMPVDGRNLELNWGRLTEVSLHSRLARNRLTLDDCLFILQEGTNLIRCFITVDCTFQHQAGTAADVDRVVHSKLRNLHLVLEHDIGLDAAAQPYLTSFLHKLDLPRLRFLTLDCDVYWGRRNWDQLLFLAFLERSSTALRVLNVIGLPLFEEELVEALAHVPLLTHLQVLARDSYEPVRDRLVQALTPHLDPQNTRPSKTSIHTSSTSCLNPRLKSIDLESRSELSSAGLMQLVESRHRVDSKISGVSNLTRVRLKGWLPRDTASGDALRSKEEDWRKEGLDVRLAMKHMDSSA